jgi:DNA-binding PadR family transcriptional regulator
MEDFVSLRSAILGLLNKEPMSGYAIKTLFDEAINFIWQAELSQIYRELDAMEKEGLVTSSIEQQHDRPNKRVYSITESGRARFMEWLTAVPEQFLVPKRDEFMLRFFFGSLAGDDVMKRSLEQMLLHVRKAREALLEPMRIAARHPGDALMARADRACREDRYCGFIKKRALMTYETIIRWAEECLAELK